MLEGAGVMILGVARTENDEETMVIDNSQINAEGLVPTNRIPEFSEDLMVLDVASTETSNEMRENASRVEDVFAIGPEENLNLPDGIDSTKANEDGEKKDVKKQLKRKRTSFDWVHDSKNSLEAACRKELEGLFEYYREVSGVNLQIQDGTCYSNNMIVASLLEEKNLPFSKLVEEIHEKLKGRDGFTLASVRSTLLFVGQRMMYGITSADADVLEDASTSCLWCWETRDMKLLPKSLRGMINIRRTARRKIHERISVLYETLCALSSFKENVSCKSDLSKSFMKLGKVLDRNEISSLVDKLKLKQCAEMAEKEAKLKQKELIKEMERNKKSLEKEKKKMDRELEKEKVQSEKELKKLKDGAEREQKRRHKEEVEEMKQIKKLEKRAAREELRRQKQDAEVKKQLVLQKQASIMDRFIIKNKKNCNSSETTDGLSPMKDKDLNPASVADAAISSMDCILSQPCDFSIEDLRRFHVAGWQKLAHSKKHRRWGIRHTPKTEVIKEIKLQKQFIGAESSCTIEIKDKSSSSFEPNNETESSYDKLADELVETFDNDIRCPSELVLSSNPVCLWHKKLLQFDKSHRPAYYGTWRKKSNLVGPRCPFQKDPGLDYDVDSDEEWEEEDPGESLSDCEKDNEEPCDEDSLKNQDGDETEDSFVVPDGYLSENEGVNIATSSDPTEDEVENSPSCKLEDENDEFKSLLQQQKFLQNLTEKALRKSQPLVISNLNHEKYEQLIVEDPVGTAKLEKICMQNLCMRPCTGTSAISNSRDDNMVYHNQECTEGMSKKECIQISKEKSTKIATAAVISDSDLLEFVKLIQSCHHGINKVVDMLQQKFPAISKLQLRNKIRETSDFIDNRWQVKKDVLEKLGLPVTPERAGKPKSIATYFSKRCLPPQGSMGISESSPDQCSQKRVSNDQDQSHQSQQIDCDARRLF